MEENKVIADIYEMPDGANDASQPNSYLFIQLQVANNQGNSFNQHCNANNSEMQRYSEFILEPEEQIKDYDLKFTALQKNLDDANTTIKE